MVRREILRQVNEFSHSPLKQTQVSLKEIEMKSKSDSRVKRYRSVLIPESLHYKLKERARDNKLRLNQYIPRLLSRILRNKNDSN